MRRTVPVTEPIPFLPGSIEAQEKAGQRAFTESDVLPVELNRDLPEWYESLGFVFGDVVDGDPLFRYAHLPKGWTRTETDHAMWSHILDEQGRVRAMVFYKAAFYDRSAHMNLCKRYSCGFDYSPGATKHCYARDWDGTTLYRSESEGYSEALDQCRAWLNANYPDWQNPVAYWGNK